MPTKNQAKTAVDNAATAIKAFIDNFLPTGVNIKDGHISFGPTRFMLVLDAGGVLSTATTWSTSIQTALTAGGRTFTVERGDRRKEDAGFKTISIYENTEATVRIVNF